MNDPKVLGVLVGNIEKDLGAQVKYGHFFQALRDRFGIVDVLDGALQGVDRLWNGLQMIHPNGRQWRERFYKNIPAFHLRSRRVSTYVTTQSKANLVLQLGVLFQVHTDLPVVIYTDYTAQLSAQKPKLGRSPFTPAQRQEWIGLERQALQVAAHIFTRGEFVRQAIITDYGIAPEKITTVGGGVNFAQLPSSQPPRVTAPTALFIGKELYRKGGDRVLKAFALARQKCPTARLLLLTAHAIPANLSTAGVEHIAPTWERRKIAALYRQAHVFVMPSRLETWGDVFLEAMAYSLPCIGMADEGMAEIIDDNKTGSLIPLADEETIISILADRLVQLFENETMRQQWGAAARRKVETFYTWEQIVANMAPVLRRL